MSEKQNSSLPSKYNPQDVEQDRYQFWLKGKFFEATDDKNKEPYTIVIPPPNVTGRLHLGHAWDTTMQDTVSRMKRMQGYDVLWLPGMDHAGIATQARVEAQLREQGKSRHDLGREKFLETVWDWKEEYADFIRQQWEKLVADNSSVTETVVCGLNGLGPTVTRFGITLSSISPSLVAVMSPTAAFSIVPSESFVSPTLSCPSAAIEPNGKQIVFGSQSVNKSTNW